MEKTAPKRGKKKPTAKQIKEAYIEHVLMEGSKPSSVFAFAKKMGANEADFYAQYNSFTALEKAIWADWFEETVKVIEEDPAYIDYTVREKLLAFFYTWLETLKSNRSFALNRFEQVPKNDIRPEFLSALKEHFKDFIADLINQGTESLEIAERPFVNQYEKALWLHFLFITRFWAHDESIDFEKTDAAIEKSVNLVFDLVGKGPVDSMIDFAKFLFQNR